MNWQLHSFQELSSTQQWLKQRIADLPDATCVLASRQTQGKGRQNRSWDSQTGGLYFSILLKPIHLYADLAWLVWVTTLQVLEQLLQRALILKAPNDLLYENGKIAGILVDAAISGNKPVYYLCGIGMNLNQTVFPHELQAVSVRQIKDQSYPPETVLHTWLAQFESLYHLPETDRKQTIFRQLQGREIQIGYNAPTYVSVEEYWHDTRG